MMSTNLDKFRVIEKMMEEARPLMVAYLAVLDERQAYMSIYRSEYRKLRNGSKEAIRIVEEHVRSKDDFSALYDDVVYAVREAIERLEEVRQTEDETEHLEKVIGALRDVLGDFKRHSGINLKAIEKSKEISDRYNIPLQGLQSFIELQESQSTPLPIESAEELLEELEKADRLYLASFREYREMCESDDEVYILYSDIVDDLLEAGLNAAADKLESVLPESSAERVARPDPQPLLSILTPIKSSGLEYFQSKNAKSESYNYNVNFARELAYTRRALLEQREMKGTNNAFKRINEAYDLLETYMYERFHQLGGTPYNYHGHLNR